MSLFNSIILSFTSLGVTVKHTDKVLAHITWCVNLVHLQFSFDIIYVSTKNLQNTNIVPQSPVASTGPGARLLCPNAVPLDSSPTVVRACGTNQVLLVHL